MRKDDDKCLRQTATPRTRADAIRRWDDDVFLRLTATPSARADAIRRWRLCRLLSFIAFLISSCAALIAIGGNEGVWCGLLSGAAAIQFAVTVSTDMKIKIALLADELDKRDSNKSVQATK